MVKLPLSQSGRTALEIAIQAAQQAGQILLARFSGEKKIHLKGEGNLVTEADWLAEESILGQLRREYPDFAILSEESGASGGPSPYTWVVDPMDGSNNFGFGLPFFCVCIALAYEGEIRLGVVYDPLRGELFQAARGEGTFLNGKLISASRRRNLRRALVGFDMGYITEKGQETLEIARELRPRVFSFRILGSGAIALAYVACGRLDIYMHRRLFPWDIAAARLLVEEAGGVATDWLGQALRLESREIVAGPRLLHREFLRWLGSRQSPCSRG